MAALAAATVAASTTYTYNPDSTIAAAINNAITVTGTTAVSAVNF